MYKKTLATMDKIFEFCKEKRKVKEISKQLEINYNTLRANYIKKMIKMGKLEKLKRAFYKSII